MAAGDALPRPAALLTDRLQLRPMAPLDYRDIHGFKSDPAVTERYGQEPHRSLMETKAWVEKRVGGPGNADSLFWTIVLRGEDKVIGECCLWNFTSPLCCAEVGYELHRSYWHAGLMSEALAALLAYSFGNIGLDRVEAVPLDANIDSQKLLRRLGFARKEVLGDQLIFRGRPMDQVRYVLNRQDWEKRLKP